MTVSPPPDGGLTERHRSLFAPIIVFAFFCSLPRLWFFVENGALDGGISSVVSSMLFGMMNDVSLAAVLLLPLILFHRALVRLPVTALNLIHGALTLALTFLLVVMMGNVEFVRYFGANANPQHFTMVSQTDVLAPSLREIFPPLKVLLIVAIATAYLILAFVIRGWLLDQRLRRRPGVLLTIAGALLGLLVNQYAGQGHDLGWQNVTQNYPLSFVRYLLVSEDPDSSGRHPIEHVLDGRRLPVPGRPEPDWFYVDPKYPLIKATAHQMCEMGLWKGARCQEDADGDGYPVMTDCNDRDPRIHPGATDIPRNGIDEDCSGLDADPPNVIYIHWEGARAVNVGAIGYADPVTPKFDALAKQGVLFRNAYANGTQTRWSLTSIYNSILPRLSSKWIFRHNPDLNMLAFPQILRSHGYQTMYLHGGDINFGNLKRRFWEWFEVMRDRSTDPEIRAVRKVGWGAPDREMFHIAYKWLSARTDPRPFYLTIATLSVHHPFKLPEPGFELKPQRELGNQVPNIMHYADDALGEFVEMIQKDPKFENTLIIISADHGLNWSQPHSTYHHSVLWEDLVWVPLLLLGKGWNVPPHNVDEVRQLADIGPTILDRLGIDVPNHFIGQSLLRSYGSRTSYAFFGNTDAGIDAGVRVGRWKFFAPFNANDPKLFDMVTDRPERNNVARNAENTSLVADLNNLVYDVYGQNNRLIRENRIWNWKYGAYRPPGAAAAAPSSSAPGGAGSNSR